MDVILISFAICVLGVMVTVLLFSIAMRPGEEEEAVADAPSNFSSPSNGFFMEEVADPSGSPGGPARSLLMELERHVRMERKAAETFLEGPNPDSLHAPTDSPLWN